MTKSWTLDVKEAPDGDKYIEFNDEILAETGWKEGDVIEWIDQGDGSFKMVKQETELVMVECVSMFRMRYVVEVPKGKSEWALDTVTCNEAKEFSQEHIGEDIVSHRVVSKEEAIAICDIDNNYCSEWTEEQKVNAFFTLRKDYE
jgi:hypothetical protein